MTVKWAVEVFTVHLKTSWSRGTILQQPNIYGMRWTGNTAITRFTVKSGHPLDKPGNYPCRGQDSRIWSGDGTSRNDISPHECSGTPGPQINHPRWHNVPSLIHLCHYALCNTDRLMQNSRDVSMQGHWVSGTYWDTSFRDVPSPHQEYWAPHLHGVGGGEEDCVHSLIYESMHYKSISGILSSLSSQPGRDCCEGGEREHPRKYSPAYR